MRQPRRSRRRRNPCEGRKQGMDRLCLSVRRLRKSTRSPCTACKLDMNDRSCVSHGAVYRTFALPLRALADFRTLAWYKSRNTSSCQGPVVGSLEPVASFHCQCAVLQVLRSRLAALTTLAPRLWRPAMTAIAPRPGCALVHKALLVACLQSVSIHAAASLRHPSVVLLHLACRALVDNLKRASENCDYQQHCKAALRIQECCSCRCFSPTRTSLTQDLTCVWSCAPPCLLRVGCLTWTS